VSKKLLLLGIIFTGLGILFIIFSLISKKIPLFRLPGDIIIEEKEITPGLTGGIYFPVVSCLLISIILTLLINLVVYILSKK